MSAPRFEFQPAPSSPVETAKQPMIAQKMPTLASHSGSAVLASAKQ